MEAALVQIAVHDDRAAIPGIIDHRADDAKRGRLPRFRQSDGVTHAGSVEGREILRDENVVRLPEPRVQLNAGNGTSIPIGLIEPLRVEGDDEHELVAELGLMEAHRQSGPDRGESRLDLIAEILLERHVLPAAADRAAGGDKQIGGDGFIHPFENPLFVAANDASGLQHHRHTRGQSGNDQARAAGRPPVSLPNPR